jgi:hypothetical protein
MGHEVILGKEAIPRLNYCLGSLKRPGLPLFHLAGLFIDPVSGLVAKANGRISPA